MLPNRFALTQKSEERLKRDRQKTGISPNIMARELFFKSIELGPIHEKILEFKAGQMVLDKSTWLGELETATERVIKNMYGCLESEEAAKRWAIHIESTLFLDPPI